MEHNSNSGAGEANNSSNETQSSISSPPNQSYRLSLYIAALDRFLGLRGLVWPVTDDVNGTTLTFDFYHPEDRSLVKIFQTLAPEEVARYKGYYQDHDVIFLFD